MKKGDGRLEWPELRNLRPLPPTPPPTLPTKGALPAPSGVAPLIPIHQARVLPQHQQQHEPANPAAPGLRADPLCISVDSAVFEQPAAPSGARTSRASYGGPTLATAFGAVPPPYDSRLTGAAPHDAAPTRTKPGAPFRKTDAFTRPADLAKGPWHWQSPEEDSASPGTKGASSPQRKPKKPGNANKQPAVKHVDIRRQGQQPQLRASPALTGHQAAAAAAVPAVAAAVPRISAPPSPDLRRRQTLPAGAPADRPSARAIGDLSGHGAPLQPPAPVRRQPSGLQPAPAGAAVDGDARRIARAITKVEERQRAARRLLDEASKARLILMRAALRQAYHAVRNIKKPAAQVTLRALKDRGRPTLATLKAALRALRSVRLAAARRQEGDASMSRSSFLRARPTALDPNALALEPSPSPPRGVDAQVQTPLDQRRPKPHVRRHARQASGQVLSVLDFAADDGAHLSSSGDYHQGTGGTPDHLGASSDGPGEDDDLVVLGDYEAFSPHLVDGMGFDAPAQGGGAEDIPDETDAAVSGGLGSPQLNGEAVASMIELFDAMYDAETFELADFGTPALGKPSLSSPARLGSTARHTVSSHGQNDSMAYEAQTSSPSQARIFADVAGDSMTSPVSPVQRRELRRFR
jgi:hypothetical protein